MKVLKRITKKVESLIINITEDMMQVMIVSRG